MPDAVTALGGAGRSEGIAAISEIGPRGMITLRGDFADPAVTKALKEVTGADVPDTRRIGGAGDLRVAWMSPDEVLILCDYTRAPDMAQALEAALGAAHALVAVVSDARAAFRVEGPHAREVLAKLCPVDLAPDRFGPGEMRRTRLAQVAAAFWMPADDAFELVCFRSVARYVFDVLCVAAQPGSEVDYFPA